MRAHVHLPIGTARPGPHERQRGRPLPAQLWHQSGRLGSSMIRPRNKAGRCAAYPNSKLSAGNFGDGLSYTLGFAEVKAWQPYYRNGGGGARPPPPAAATSPAWAANSRPTAATPKWVDRPAPTRRDSPQPSRPTLVVPATSAARATTLSWTSQQEGKSTTVATYAAVTARSLSPAAA